MSIASRVSGLVNVVGETATYKRKTAEGSLNTTTLQKTPTYTNYTIKISARKYTLREISAGLVDAGDREIRIASSDISFTPSRGDIVVIASKNYKVISVDTRTAKNENALHILRVGGDNA